MSSDERQLALNQAVTRDANEAAEEVATAWSPPADPITVRCECSRSDCAETLRLSLEEYEAVRDDPQLFVLVAGHVDERVDRVIGAIRSYVLVEKVGNAAREVAGETDPRS
jgi:hypothetical protein